MRRSRIRPRVLIVDDHEDTRAELRALLEGAGIEVVGEAEGGLRGVAMAEELKPDVVLMDVRMPYLDGIKATRHIKEAVPEVAVILLTAYDVATLETSAEEAQAYCYLLKDGPASMIVEMINRAWEFGRSAHSA